jgi:hypothetical protein
MWFNIVARLLNPKHPDRLPKPTEIERPEWLTHRRERKVETDPRVIAAFFRANFMPRGDS